MFIDFASFGSRQTFADMDGAKFFKLCKDTRLVTKAFTVIDVDIIFAKVSGGPHVRLAFAPHTVMQSLTSRLPSSPLVDLATTKAPWTARS